MSAFNQYHLFHFQQHISLMVSESFAVNGKKYLINAQALNDVIFNDVSHVSQPGVFFSLV